LPYQHKVKYTTTEVRVCKDRGQHVGWRIGWFQHTFELISAWRKNPPQPTLTFFERKGATKTVLSQSADGDEQNDHFL
jgi:hypothetical protein